jgi:hypothetical protein
MPSRWSRRAFLTALGTVSLAGCVIDSPGSSPTQEPTDSPDETVSPGSPGGDRTTDTENLPSTTEIPSNDILRAVNGAVSSVGVSAGLRFPGSNIPVFVDGTRVCALFFGTFVRAR